MKPELTPANNNLTPCRMLISGLFFMMVAAAPAAVIQTNDGTDGTIPGGVFVTTGNLLATNLSSTGSFYEAVPDLGRLYDGQLGTLGSGGSIYTVMPNLATLQFTLDGAFNLTTIRTYASWDSGRDGQRYVVKYATAAAPGIFTTLHSVSAYDAPSGGARTTLVTLTDTTGVLAENVVSLQFVFDGYENGGTGFREFQVVGTAVPEPNSFLASLVVCYVGIFYRRRPKRAASCLG